MPSRESMISELKTNIIPLLKAAGFRGSFPHFQRIKNEKLNLLTFQFDKWGGGFCIEIANGNPNGIDKFRDFLPASKMRPYHLLIRPRLGTTNVQEDYWFRYDDDNYASTSIEVINSMPIAEKWFEENEISN